MPSRHPAMCRVFFYLAMGTRPDGRGSSQEDEGQGKQEARYLSQPVCGDIQEGWLRRIC
ncbi:hypothetical protein AERO8C_140333 [Aeromonas veronii]|uniref:Uncharacterized protein n=1 Tax=Aeromonas veronii TaxID=654 RepID=A0A653KVB5_AERVE|nr:hypothetical protein AERO8C_140333 [Aeromonas veronii]